MVLLKARDMVMVSFCCCSLWKTMWMLMEEKPAHRCTAYDPSFSVEWAARSFCDVAGHNCSRVVRRPC